VNAAHGVRARGGADAPTRPGTWPGARAVYAFECPVLDGVGVRAARSRASTRTCSSTSRPTARPQGSRRMELFRQRKRGWGRGLPAPRSARPSRPATGHRGSAGRGFEPPRGSFELNAGVSGRIRGIRCKAAAASRRRSQDPGNWPTWRFARAGDLRRWVVGRGRDPTALRHPKPSGWVTLLVLQKGSFIRPESNARAPRSPPGGGLSDVRA